MNLLLALGNFIDSKNLVAKHAQVFGTLELYLIFVLPIFFTKLKFQLPLLIYIFFSKVGPFKLFFYLFSLEKMLSYVWLAIIYKRGHLDSMGCRKRSAISLSEQTKRKKKIGKKERENPKRPTSSIKENSEFILISCVFLLKRLNTNFT